MNALRAGALRGYGLDTAKSSATANSADERISPFLAARGLWYRMVVAARTMLLMIRAGCSHAHAGEFSASEPNR
jgi:hypothetical protein